MATDHHHGDEIVADDEVEGGEEYLDPNDVFTEAPDDDEDAYMDDPDGEGEDGGDGAADDQQGPQEGEDEIVFEDNSIQQFPTHRKSVFAVSVHPTLPIAASGGEDELGYLWNITDGEQIARLSGHTDSVSSTAFSADGTMIVTGGMDGKVRVWRKLAGDPTGKQWEFLTEVIGPDEVMVCSRPQ
jgi:ribosome assembly protein SQT1